MKNSKCCVALLLLVMLFGSAGTAPAQMEITFVAANATNTQQWIDFAQSIYGLDTVVTVGQYATIDIPFLNSQDLIVVIRNTGSGDYDDDAAEIAAWNALTPPLLLQSCYLTRNGNKWYWVNDNGTPTNTVDTLLVSDATDPIFAGMGLNNGDPVQIFNAPHPFQTNGTIDVGNGTLVAQVPGETRFVIARWTASVTPAEFYTGGGVHTAERLFFACPEEDGNDNINYLDDATPLGLQMMENAFTSLLPLPLPKNGFVLRTLPHIGLFAVGITVPVTLTATPDLGGVVTAIETVPAGETLLNVSASAGTPLVVGNTITWTVTLGATAETLTYDVMPVSAATQLNWTGTVDAGVGWPNVPLGGDDSMIGNVPLGDFDWHGDIGVAPVGAVGGNPSVPGSAVLSSPTYTLTAAGADFWNAVDRGHIAAKIMEGDFIMDAHLNWIDPGVNIWSKAGIMVRGSIDSSSASGQAGFRNPANSGVGVDTIYQWRDTDGVNSAGAGERAFPAPGWMRLVRIGDSLSAYYGPDGVNWTLFETHTVPGFSRDQVLACIFVTSHQDDGSGDTTVPALPALPVVDLATVNINSVSFTALAIASPGGVRTIGATEYALGDIIPVTLDIEHEFDANPLVVVEHVPPGWAVVNASAGSTIDGTTITWTLDNFTASVQLTYDVAPAGGVANSGVFDGVIHNPVGFDTFITGDTTINRVASLPIIYISGGGGNQLEDLNMKAVIGSAGLTVALPAPTTVMGLGYTILELDGNAPEETADFTLADGRLIFISESCDSGSPAYHQDDGVPMINNEQNLVSNGDFPRNEMLMSDGHADVDLPRGPTSITITVNTHPITEIWALNQDVTLWEDRGHDPRMSAGIAPFGTAVEILGVPQHSPADLAVAWYPAGTNESGLIMPGNLATFTAPAARMHLPFHDRAFQYPTVDGVLLLQRAIQFMVGDPVNAGDPDPPAAPSSLLLDVLAGLRIELNWLDNADNESGYVIARRQGAGGLFVDIAQVSGFIATYTDTTAVSGEDYTYRVRAFNYAGESANSNEVKPEDNPIINATATTTSMLLPARDTQLSGTAVDYFPGGIKATTWTLISSPGNNASTATIASPNALVTTATVNGTTGTYVFQLAALDMLDNLGTGTVNVSLYDLSNTPPVIDAGPDQQTGKPFGAPITATLSGTAVDPEGQPLTITWSVISTPQGASSLIAEPNLPQTNVALDNVLGAYVFRLTVSDGAFEATDDVRINIIHVEATAARPHWQLFE